jgi:alpha-beta hydrolase superfamily lysophospholipase
MHTLTTGDGLRLHLRRWPAAGTARGTVQIVHGLGEHIERYAPLAAALNTAGWHVAGHDQRGHGRSEGPRGAIPGSHALLYDLAAVSDHLRGPGRHVLLGHSMGGLVAARFVAETMQANPARWQREIDALVLSSPALDPGLNPLQRLLLQLLGSVAPNLGVGNGLKPAWISRDAAVVAQYRADPLVHRLVTPQLVRFIVDEGRHVLTLAPRWRTPTLLMWAQADRCVAPAGSQAFAAAAPASVVTAQGWPGLYHEIFNEPERDQVIARLTDWIARF